MEPCFHPRVKVCCISSVEEAWLAIRCGASALGLVSEMPSGPGVISEARIAEIAAIVPPGITTFLLTCKQEPEAIIAQHQRCATNCIQLVDKVLPGSHTRIKAALPGISLVQVIHVSGEESIEEAVELAEHVDAILLDSGNANLKVKVLGGTGRTHNWEFSRRIRKKIDKPLFLAGGLTAQNAPGATLQVAPFGLDLCSGVRTEGKLDATKLLAFFTSLQNLKGTA